MIDDGQKVTLTPAEYDHLLADLARVFLIGAESVPEPPWYGPREVYVLPGNEASRA